MATILQIKVQLFGQLVYLHPIAAMTFSEHKVNCLVTLKFATVLSIFNSRIIVAATNQNLRYKPNAMR